MADNEKITDSEKDPKVSTISDLPDEVPNELPHHTALINRHAILERSPTLLLIFSLLVVTIGGIVDGAEALLKGGLARKSTRLSASHLSPRLSIASPRLGNKPSEKGEKGEKSRRRSGALLRFSLWTSRSGASLAVAPAPASPRLSANVSPADPVPQMTTLEVTQTEVTQTEVLDLTPRAGA